MNAFLMLVFWFGVTALAVFRVAELLVFDDGPGNMFARLRAWTGMYERDEFGKPFVNATRAQRRIGGLLECPFCVGVWLSFFGALTLLPFAELCDFDSFVHSALSILHFALIWLALAGTQAFLESVGGCVWRS